MDALVYYITMVTANLAIELLTQGDNRCVSTLLSFGYVVYIMSTMFHDSKNERRHFVQFIRFLYYRFVIE